MSKVRFQNIRPTYCDALRPPTVLNSRTDGVSSVLFVVIKDGLNLHAV